METINQIEKASPKILKQESIDNSITLILYSNNIFEIKWNEDIRVIGKNDLVKIRQFIEFMGQGKQLLIYFATHEFLTISKEAREFAASTIAQEYTIANGVLVDTLSKKIIFNFFLRINKPYKPTKGFTTKSEAIEWLLQQKIIREN